MDAHSGVETRALERRAPIQATAATRLTNWGRDVALEPSVVVRPRTVDDIVAVLTDFGAYPSPVRAVGSRHSTTLCAVADGGTIVDMSGMNRILEIGPDTVRAEAGALHLDVARELRKHGLQFYVNAEIGSMSLGSASCCGTKDASMPGEFGQASSYASAIKMVTPSGDLREITEEEPELLQAARSSYGLMGIVYEVTFKVSPLQVMAVEHETYTLDEFERELPSLAAQNESMMMYIYPFLERVAVEFRKYRGLEGKAPGMASVLPWKIRNFAWKSVGPGFGYLAVKLVPNRRARYFLIDQFNRLTQLALHYLVRHSHTIPTDQIISYPKESDWTRYTFSIQAFPESDYIRILRAYFAWIKRYYRETGYRPNLLHVGYRIEKDQSSLLSYAFDTNVMTIDPVSTGGPGWDDFLRAYNEFCSDHGGAPLLNQTKWIAPHQAVKAFGERLKELEQHRKQFDPNERLLSRYFAELLAAPVVDTA